MKRSWRLKSDPPRPICACQDLFFSINGGATICESSISHLSVHPFAKKKPKKTQNASRKLENPKKVKKSEKIDLRAKKPKKSEKSEKIDFLDKKTPKNDFFRFSRSSRATFRQN